MEEKEKCLALGSPRGYKNKILKSWREQTLEKIINTLANNPIKNGSTQVRKRVCVITQLMSTLYPPLKVLINNGSYL